MEGGIGLQDYQTNNLLDTLENSDLLIFWGADLETTPHGFTGQLPSVYHYWYNQAGKKCIYICPDGNYAAVIHGDKWIPILPNTDIALHLAIAYVWIMENLYDKDYVATHTLGFDESSLPPGAPAGSSFKSYVLGLQDDVPKTPQWAEQISGVPSRVIKALARTWAKHRTSIVHHFGGGYIRGPYSSNVARTEVYLLAMQGVGKPGVQQVQVWGNQGTLVSSSLAFGPAMVPTAGAIEPFMSGNSSLVIDPPFIVKTLVPDAVLNPPVTWYGRCASIGTPVAHQFVKTVFPQEGFSEIHMMWKESGCWIPCWNGGAKYMETLRSPKIEFLVQQHPWFENDCLFADLVLPVTTVAEDDIDLLSSRAGEQFSVLYLHHAAIPPVGESKSDLEIVELVSDKLGIKDQVVPWATHEEAIRFGFKMSGAAQYISWDDFAKKQYWVAPVDPKWAERPRGMTWYWKQPKGSKLQTKSGMIEFYCQGLAEHFPNDTERPVVAKYVPDGIMYQESRNAPKAKKYPYLIISNHPRWRMHVQGDDITWLREIGTCKVTGPDGYQYEPVWIHPVEAAKKGIKSGDIVMIYNDLGAVLGGAYVTERIVPGSVYMDHGAQLDLISLDPPIDRGGSINILTPRPTKWPDTPSLVAEMVVTGYLVDVKKADMQSLMTKYPAAFEKKYDPHQGPLAYDTLVRGDHA
jgi:anaerobic selenocysteine-containing dehydrogenase